MVEAKCLAGVARKIRKRNLRSVSLLALALLTPETFYRSTPKFGVVELSAVMSMRIAPLV